VVSGGVVVLGVVVLGVVVLGLVVLGLVVLGDVGLGVMLEDGVALLGDMDDGVVVEVAEVSGATPRRDDVLGTSLLTRWPLVTSPPEARVVRARRARVLSVVVPVRVLSLAVPVRGVVPVVGCWACAASAPPTASAAASARALSGAFRTRMCSSF
jgi:hypothetical protein